MRKTTVCFPFLFAALALACATARYCPESDFETRLIDDGAAVMISYYLGSSRTVRIPPRIRGLPVTQIGQNAFHSKNIARVSIPYGVTSIGNWAFRYNRLTGVSIPDTVSVIGRWAFADNRIAGVVIPDGVVVIGEAAFAANRLSRVSVPDGVGRVERWTFQFNELAGATVPSGAYVHPEAFDPGVPIIRR